MPSAREITAHLDSLLDIARLPDYPNALNGVQVEGSADGDGEVTRIAAAVDARLATIQGAADAGAELLLVHHGLFWGGVQPLRGPFRARVRALLEHGITLYSAHLPLDAHPTLGNNALLARALGLTPRAGFARFRELEIGVRGEDTLPAAELAQRAERFAREWGGHARHAGLTPGCMTRHWAVCTGAGASLETLRESTALGVDTLIVGEGPHWTAVDASEMGLAIIYAGHYATETLGVRALAEHLAGRFGVPWSFVDAPTGL